MFSRTFIASALLGFAAATTHAGEAVAVTETLAAHTSTVMAAHTSTVLAAHTSTALAAAETPAVHMSVATSVAHAIATGAAEGMVNTHVIQVGGPNGTLVFSPENIAAQPGDLVQFQFNPKNHSVVQSTFDQPCVPIQNIMPNKTDAFFSGFMPANASAVAAGNVLTYTIRVMDTKPIWFYCSQGQHCQNGMVGAINAAQTGNKTMAAFKALAAAAPENLSPGQVGGQGATAQPSTAPGGAQNPPAGGATQTAGGATPSSPDNPLQATTAAAGRLTQSFFALALTVFAAFMAL